MEKVKAGEGSHREGHQAPTEGSFPIVTGGGSNGELKITAEPKVTVDPPVTNATETLASPGSASTVPMAGAPVRNATEAMASPGSASKAPTAGGQVSSPAGNTASPGSASKVQKSVKHLECAYYFGSKEGCKWTEEQCLYSHTPTGSRATAPVQIEPGSKFEPHLFSLCCSSQSMESTNQVTTIYERDYQLLLLSADCLGCLSLPEIQPPSFSFLARKWHNYE